MQTTTKTTYNWDFIMTDSDYNISLKLLEVYNNGDYEELGKALQAFHEGSIQDAKHEVYVELKLLMEEILYCIVSPKMQTQKRWEKICRHRQEIEDYFEDYKFITKQTLLDKWTKALEAAKYVAESHFEIVNDISELSWLQVFEKVYLNNE